MCHFRDLHGQENLKWQEKNLLRENEAGANRVIAKVQLAISAVYYLAGFLMFFGIFHGAQAFTYSMFAFGTIFIFLSLSVLLKKRQKPMPFLKYLCIFLLLFSVFQINVLVGYKFRLLYALPILLSARYYDRRFTAITGIFAILLTFCSAYTNAYLSEYTRVLDLNLVSFSEPGTLKYYGWLYNAVLNHGIDPKLLVHNALLLSTFPDSLVIILIIIAANSVINNAVRLLMQTRENYEREIQLLQNAMTDSMTGLWNRRAYNEDAAKLQHGMPKDLVFISLDVDGLKTANDTMGHTAGDELLTGAARCIQETFGDYGKVYGMGGDEFVALIHADTELLLRLQADLSRRVSAWSGSMIKKLSVSAGYVPASELAPTATIDDLATLADKRMYAVKDSHYSVAGLDRRRQ